MERAESREVDAAEVLRRGDRVTRAGQGPQRVDQQLFGEATAPPPDDAHKWFITIIEDGGAESQALLYDAKHSPQLRAWLNVDEPKDSWSHCTVYKKDDQTQHWRWSSLRMSRFPVMIIQPPAKLRNEAEPESWIWGNPKTVVWQWDGYDAANPNRAALRSDAIRKAMSLYVSSVAAKQRQPLGPRRSDAAPPPTAGARQTKVIGGPEQQDNYGISPPFAIPPSTPVPTTPIFPVDPTVPGLPIQQPQTPSAISLLLSILGGAGASGGFTNILLLGLIGVQLWRTFRKATGQPTLLDDTAFGRLEELLKGLAGQTPKA